MEEGVTLVRLGVGSKLFGAQAQSAVNVCVAELVDGLETGAERAKRDEALQGPGTRSNVLDSLNLIEGIGESLTRSTIRRVNFLWLTIGLGPGRSRNVSRATYVRDLTSRPSRKSVATSRVYRNNKSLISITLPFPDSRSTFWSSPFSASP